MKRALVAVGALLAAVMAVYLLTWPVPIDPVAWDAPVDRGLVDPFAAPMTGCGAARGIALGEHSGPEDATLGLRTATCLRQRRRVASSLSIDSGGRYDVFADVGGRPLGIETAPDGALIVANAYVGRAAHQCPGRLCHHAARQGCGTGRWSTRTTSPLRRTARSTFSEASTRFGAQRIRRHLCGLASGCHGTRRPRAGHRVSAGHRRRARASWSGLNFANGVAISDDQALPAHRRDRLLPHPEALAARRSRLAAPRSWSTICRVFRTTSITACRADYWIGLVAPRDSLLDAASDIAVAARNRAASAGEVPAGGRLHRRMCSRVNGDGDVLMDLQDSQARFSSADRRSGDRATRSFLTALFGRELGVLRKADL